MAVFLFCAPKWVLFCLLWINSAHAAGAPQTQACTVLLRVTDYRGDDVAEIETWECFQPGLGHLKLENLPPGWEDEVRGKSGKLNLFAPGAVIDGNVITLPPNAKLNEILTPRRRPRRLASDQPRSVLVVRIIAPDSTPTILANELSDKVFGTGNDSVNLKSQFAACSYNQLQFEPAVRLDPLVADGVYDVTISMQVTGVSASTVQNWVTQQLETDFNVATLEGLFDHIMYVMPPGTLGSWITPDDWIASAYLDNWLSLYNDNWATFVSVQMHEIGHNENLGHSGENDYEYDDQTCMMGYSYEEDDTPLMCFNAPKNYQLGWYADRQITVTATWTGDLVGVADYGTSSANQFVYVRIPGDWFVSFNRKDGINLGSVEVGADDKVLIHRKFFNDNKSKLWAKLSPGGSFVYPNYAGSGQDLIITVDSITQNASPWFATVRVCFGAASCCEPAGNSCRSSDDCCGSLLCLGKGRIKSCKECEVNNDCDNNVVCDGEESCVNNECIPGIPLGSDCCDGASDCATGQQCVGNSCCAPLDGSCGGVENAVCCSGLVCNGGTCASESPTCAPLYASCVTTDCCSGLVCNGSTCISEGPSCAPLNAPCEVDNDCCVFKCRGKEGNKSCK